MVFAEPVIETGELTVVGQGIEGGGKCHQTIDGTGISITHPGRHHTLPDLMPQITPHAI